MSDLERVRREACAIGRHDMGEWKEEAGREVSRCQVTGCSHFDQRHFGEGHVERQPYDPYREL